MVFLHQGIFVLGINIILGAAEGEIVADADVQKAALRVIVNCVCAPIHRVCYLSEIYQYYHYNDIFLAWWKCCKIFIFGQYKFAK